MGSADISDRALDGSRNSEVCLHFRDTRWRRSFMNDKAFKAGKFSWSLRTALMAKHLGLDRKMDKDKLLLIDPVTSNFYVNVWQKTAAENSLLFEKVSCILVRLIFELVPLISASVP